MGLNIKLPFIKRQTTPKVIIKNTKTNKPLKEAIKLLKSHSLQDRRLGSERLRLLNSPLCVPILIKHLESSEDREILSNVISTLSNLRDIRATEKLIALIKSSLQSSTSNVYIPDAISALTNSKDPRAGDFIYSLLKNYHPQPAATVVYMAVIHGLGELRYKKAYKELFTFIRDKTVNKYLREYAVEAVIKIDKKKSIHPLLQIFETEDIDWPFRRKIIYSIVYGRDGKLIKELKKYENDVDPDISNLIKKYLSGESLFRRNETKKVIKKKKSKYLITHDWWHDVIEYRRWINDLFKSKFSLQGDLFTQNECIVRDLKGECQNENDFNTLILNLTSQIDSIKADILDPLISSPPKPFEGSINKIEFFLSERLPSYDYKIISNLRTIHKIRNKKAPIHITAELPELLTQLGFNTYPPEWQTVWEKLKELYIEALKLLKDNLETI